MQHRETSCLFIYWRLRIVLPVNRARRSRLIPGFFGTGPPHSFSIEFNAVPPGTYIESIMEAFVSFQTLLSIKECDKRASRRQPMTLNTLKTNKKCHGQNKAALTVEKREALECIIKQQIRNVLFEAAQLAHFLRRCMQAKRKWCFPPISACCNVGFLWTGVIPLPGGQGCSTWVASLITNPSLPVKNPLRSSHA